MADTIEDKDIKQEDPTNEELEDYSFEPGSLVEPDIIWE